MSRSAVSTILALFVLSCFTTPLFAEQQYRFGFIPDDNYPEWLKQSPVLQYNGGQGELDEECDNSDGLPPVGSQGMQGSCVAWSAGYYLMTYVQGRDYEWDLTDSEHQCSPAFVYNLINGGIDDGSSNMYAFTVFMELGCGTLEDMPYNDNDYTTFPSETAFRNGVQFRISDAFVIPLERQRDLGQLKTLLLNGNIAVFAIMVYDNLQNIDRYDNTYCLSDIPGAPLGSHQVTVVGFDDDMETNDGTGAFRVVNSWGSGWGDDGFFWMSYEAMINMYTSFQAAFYVEDRNDYNPNLLVRVAVEHEDRFALQYHIGLGEHNRPEERFGYFSHTFSEDQVAFEPGSAFVLDITDMQNLINENGENNIFLDVEDNYGGDGYDGSVISLSIENLSEEYEIYSTQTPMDIPNNYSYGTVDIILDYSILPPVNLEADLNNSNGIVSLSWDVDENGNELDEFIVYRNGLEIRTTANLEYDDLLESYAENLYSVATTRDVSRTNPCEEVSVEWYAPVAPRFTRIYSVEAETGEYLLKWDQVRNEEYSYDDGSAESNLSPSGNAQPGVMIGQRISLSDPGIITGIGAYFMDGEGIEGGHASLVVFEEGDDGLPGAVLYRSSRFLPSQLEWNWDEIVNRRIYINSARNIWAAVCWNSLDAEPLGRDTDGGEQSQTAVATDGENWIILPLPGSPMIRITYGTEEIFENETGLTGYNVSMDGSLLDRVEDDACEYAGSFLELGTYEFMVEAIYEQGAEQGELHEFTWDGGEVGVGENKTTPYTWRVTKPYPNPFNPTTNFSIELADNVKVEIAVYNLAGQRVALISKGNYSAGNHRMVFDGSGLSTGMYFLRINAGPINVTRKIVLMK
ncbi:MAG: T9SS type A sorting domain-containing protein [Candidatus Electryonea clarkiae]|nr:T9SS type A sorting domain-containing protein [Candidatus Electryonea clarkiae]MDP8288648.1 T9SS type A sorting domain-containing protein [Candidatus Electryonea clarkiae]